MNASQSKAFANRIWLITAVHQPVIRLFRDAHLVKPHVVKDTGGGQHFFLSRHKTDLGARRALGKYRRMMRL